MARSAGSTFDSILPIAKKHRVAALNWGIWDRKDADQSALGFVESSLH
jgi:hypothetical protein